MDKNEKISIIVPVYNAEKYLKKCINSIINQTYSNLEIILIDDGSTDNSGNICDEFAKKDNRILVIHKKNEGLSATRNVGIEKATGEFIGFVDSDDYIEKDMYEILYKDITRYDADVASISISMVKKNGKKISGTDTNERNIYENDDIIKELLLHKTLKNYSCDKLYKAELFENIRYIVGVAYEDVPFMFKIMSKAKKVVYYDAIKYFYVKHENSLSAVTSEKNVNDYIDAIINRFILTEKEYKSLNIYNLYAIANTAIHAYYKVMLSSKSIENHRKKLDFLKDKCEYIYNNFEKEVVGLFSVYQKACFYMLLNDEELFMKFLKERKKKSKSISAS